jgi:hypothetical protein
MSTRDSEGRVDLDSGNLDELMEFLQGKLDPEDLSKVALMFSYDPERPAQDAPPYRGRDVPRTLRQAQDAGLRKIIADARGTQRRQFEEHRDSLGLRPIRNLG